MTALHHLSLASLRTVIVTDPERRMRAWDELRFRNQSKQAWSRENGLKPAQPPGLVVAMPTRVQRLLNDLGVKPWNPPDLSDPEPPREGPMV